MIRRAHGIDNNVSGLIENKSCGLVVGEVMTENHHRSVGMATHDSQVLNQLVDDFVSVLVQGVPIVKDNHVEKFKFYVTIYSGQELKDRMERVGFESVKLYGSLDGSPYDSDAQRLIIVGLRPV